MNAVCLPSVSDAPLPVLYSQARHALAECSRVDECKDWANKAEALASYARQSKDEGLYKVAMRIQGRAIRRCGELLQEIEPTKFRGNQHAAVRDGDGPNRKQAASEAGLSQRQAKTALRVANVPHDDFEEQIESDTPPTLTELGEQGTRKKPPPIYDLEGIDPEDFKVATRAGGAVHYFCQETDGVDFQQATRGLKGHEMKPLCEQIAIAKTRLIELENALCTTMQT